MAQPRFGNRGRVDQGRDGGGSGDFEQLAKAILTLKDVLEKVAKSTERREETARERRRREKREASENFFSGGIRHITPALGITGAALNVAQTAYDIFAKTETYKQEQETPYERTKDVVYKTAMAGRQMTRKEIKALFDREAALGRKYAESMEDLEYEGGLAPDIVIDVERRIGRGILRGAKYVRDFIDDQTAEWLPGGRR